MRKGAAARRYALALIDIGKTTKAFEQYGKELSAIAFAFKEAPALYKALLNPMYKIEERRSLATEVAVKSGAGEVIQKFMAVLVDTRGVKLIEDIAVAYSRMEDEIAGRVRATVESPVELDNASLESIKQKLKNETKKDVVLSFKKNTELLGGLVIKVGNKTLDGSLKSQLTKFKEKLLEGAL